MSVIFKCDGCNVEVEQKSSFKPSSWYTREDEDGQQYACSRKCIEIVAEKSGKTGLVLPI